jgi:cation transport ATPase
VERGVGAALIAAARSMAFSSFNVVMNSLRLRGVKV